MIPRYFMLIILFGVSISISAHAEPLNPSDFAKGLVLEIDSGASIYKFTLPEFVYEGVTRDDLGDIRVFNKEGEVVPFSIRHQEMKIRKQANTPPVTKLPIYPIYGKTADGSYSDSVAIKIVTDSRGAVVHIDNNRRHDSKGQYRHLNHYLIDLTGIEQSPDQLSFHWGKNEENLVTKVSVDGSNDLSTWKTLVRSAALVDISFGEHQLSRNRVNLPYSDYKYMKVRWQKPGSPLVLTSINAEYSGGIRFEEQPRRWTRLSFVKKNSDSTHYFYSNKYHLPIDRIRVSFPQNNTLVKALLKSRMDESDEWVLRHSGLLYKLTVEGMELENDSVRLTPVTDIHWQLSIDSAGGGLGSGTPQFDIGWIPHEIYFIARGSAPFTLAYGSGKVVAEDTKIDSFLKKFKEDEQHRIIKKARMSSSVELGGRKQLEKPEKPVNWKKITLWVILLSGVAATGIMALSLYRQLGEYKK